MSDKKNTGAQLNRDLMKKLIGTAKGVDVSHIKVKDETGRNATGLKPTPEELERWSRGEDINEGNSPSASSSGPTVRVHDVHKNTIKSFLAKQSNGAVPSPVAPPKLAPTAVHGVRGNDPDIIVNYTGASSRVDPLQQLNKSYAYVDNAPVPVVPQRVSIAPVTLPTKIAMNEQVLTEELPVTTLRQMLTGLGEAMVNSAGGRFGISDHYSLTGDIFEVVFQHRTTDTGADSSGLQISAKLTSEGEESISSITVLLGEEAAAIKQTVTRHYRSPQTLIEDLPDLIESLS
jgi:hypothetical protein